MARMSLASGPGALAAGAVAVAVVGGAVYLAVTERPLSELEQVAAIPSEAEEDSAAALPVPVTETDTASETEATTQTDTAQEETAAAPERESVDEEETAPPPIRPKFDLVRAEADGQVLVAGMAAPGHALRLDVDGEKAGEGDADGQGNFVLFLNLPVTDQPRVLDLFSTGPDGSEVRAEESVILAPPPPPVVAEVTAEPEVTDELAPAADDGAMEEADATDEPAELAEAEAEVDPPVSDDTEVAAVETAPAPEPEPELETVEPDQPQPETVAATPVVGGAADAATAAPSSADAVAQVAEGVRPTQDAAAVPSTAVADDAQRVAEAGEVEGTTEATSALQSSAEPVSGATQATAGAASAVASTAIGATEVGAASGVAPVQPVAAEVQRAPSVLVARDDGVSLLQPSAAQAARLDRVVIDVISYDAAGTVTLEGRSAAPPPPVDRVRIYLNNAPIDTARILDDGSWRVPLEGVASGVYTLRVDQLDPAGNVVSRFETPFKREDPANLARLEAERPEVDGVLDVSVITVQPGYTLWGIASDRYGDGFQYLAIFDANADQIRDPDLIYPGQVFDLPDTE